MEKYRGLIFTLCLLFFQVVLIVSLTACGIDETQQDQPTWTNGSSPTPVSSDDNTSTGPNAVGNENVESETMEQETAETETQEEVKAATVKYAVNPKNNKIYAVKDEGDTKTNNETEIETIGQGEHTEEEKIALLTFDDTPTAGATVQILDILDQYDAKAIFFVNGHYAERNVEMLKEIKERGHIIGNHTWWHIYIRKESPEKVREEIVRLSDFLEEHLGERPMYFRPPFGQNSDVSLQVIREEGMQTMNWSNGSLDWELKSSDAVVEQVLSNMSNGDNILFHDKKITADALEPILKELSAQGYKFVLPTEVTVPEE